MLFGIFYDRKSMFSAHFIGDITQLIPRTFTDLPLIAKCLKSFAVDEIRVIENNMNMHMRFIIVNGEIRTLMFRTLSLRSHRSHYSFQQSRTWHVTEYDIGNAVTALARKDPSAQARLEACNLTNRDVEYIIEKATFGILKLELDDYE